MRYAREGVSNYQQKFELLESIKTTEQGFIQISTRAKTPRYIFRA